MNRFLPFLTVFLAVLMAGMGCKKNDANSFRVDQTSEFDIQGGVGLNVPIEILIPLSTTEVKDELAARGFSLADVADLYLNYVGMEIISPFGKDFSFLQQMEVLVRAPQMPELLLASDYEFPGQVGHFIELEPTLVPLQMYFGSDQSQLVVRFVARDFVLQKLEVNFYQGYRVRAGG